MALPIGSAALRLAKRCNQTSASGRLHGWLSHIKVREFTSVRALHFPYKHVRRRQLFTEVTLDGAAELMARDRYHRFQPVVISLHFRLGSNPTDQVLRDIGVWLENTLSVESQGVRVFYEGADVYMGFHKFSIGAATESARDALYAAFNGIAKTNEIITALVSDQSLAHLQLDKTLRPTAKGKGAKPVDSKPLLHIDGLPSDYVQRSKLFLSRLKRILKEEGPSKALIYARTMHSKYGVRTSEAHGALILEALYRLGRIEDAERQIAWFQRKGYKMGLTILKKIQYMYLRINNLRKALVAYQARPFRTISSANGILGLCATLGEMEIAEIVFSKIPPTSQRQAIIDEVVSGKREKRQRSPTADRMRVDAFASRKTYDRMIEGYVKQGNIQQALTYLEKMMEEAKLNKYAQPTEVTYRYILDYFASRADEKNFFIVMDEMKQLNITMGIITYTMILRLRRYQLDEAKFQQALEEIASLNLTATTHTFNELIELYLAQGKKEKAKNVFDQLYALNLRASPGTYDPFFRYYAKVGDDIKMLEMFDMMIRDNIKPSKACQITRTYKPSFLEVPLAISTQLTEILFPTKIAVMDALINDGDLSRARIFLETIRNWRGPAYVLPVKEIYISLMEAFARQGNLQNCLHVYKLLFEEQRHDNDDVRVAVVQACGKSRNIQLAINISNEISSCLTVKSTQAFLEACVATNVGQFAVQLIIDMCAKKYPFNKVHPTYGLVQYIWNVVLPAFSLDYSVPKYDAIWTQRTATKPLEQEDFVALTREWNNVVHALQRVNNPYEGRPDAAHPQRDL